MAKSVANRNRLSGQQPCRRRLNAARIALNGIRAAFAFQYVTRLVRTAKRVMPMRLERASCFGYPVYGSLELVDTATDVRNAFVMRHYTHNNIDINRLTESQLAQPAGTEVDRQEIDPKNARNLQNEPVTAQIGGAPERNRLSSVNSRDVRLVAVAAVLEWVSKCDFSGSNRDILG